MENNDAIKVLGLQYLLCAMTAPQVIPSLTKRIESHLHTRLNISQEQIAPVLTRETLDAWEIICDVKQVPNESKLLICDGFIRIFAAHGDDSKLVLESKELVKVSSVSGLIGVLRKHLKPLSLRDLLLEFLVPIVGVKEVAGACKCINQVIVEKEYDFAVIDEYLNAITKRVFLGIPLSRKMRADSNLMILQHMPLTESPAFQLKLGYVYKIMKTLYIEEGILS